MDMSSAMNKTSLGKLVKKKPKKKKKHFSEWQLCIVKWKYTLTLACYIFTELY